MIYLISDLHGDINFQGIYDYLDIASDDDLLIIMGDIFLNFKDTEENRKFTEFILSLEKNIALIDGNHDNFEYLNSFPQEEWNGGIVGRITKNIVHLKRGNIYNIQGKTIFTLGGCRSSDRWKQSGEPWYVGDEPTSEQYKLALENLKKNNYTVDYILTHKYEQRNPGRGTVCPEYQEFTEFMDNNVQFKRWYAGHWHINDKYDDKHYFVFDILTPIE